MRSIDIGLTLLIFIIFIVLYASNLLAIGIQNIKNNWVKYRCSPMVIPFSKMLSPDGISASDNFVYCIQNTQKNYMDKFLQPINFNLNLSTNILGSLSDSINSLRASFSQLRNLTTSIFENIYNVFLNIIIEVQKITINNKYVKMSELKLGDILKDGSDVIATLKINNLDRDGNALEPYYVLKGGEKNQDIYVSGTHLIYNPYKNNFEMVCYNKDALITNNYGDYFICLITSSHIIPIGKHIFHDWEDNNGSYSKHI